MDFIFSILAAVLSGLGVGSGGLLVIWLTLAEDYPQLTAQGINLLFFLFSTGTAIIFHLTHRRIYYEAVTVLVIFGLVGSIIGSILSGVLGGDLTRRIFGVMLIISGMLALKGNKKTVSDKN